MTSTSHLTSFLYVPPNLERPSLKICICEVMIGGQDSGQYALERQRNRDTRIGSYFLLILAKDLDH